MRRSHAHSCSTTPVSRPICPSGTTAREQSATRPTEPAMPVNKLYEYEVEGKLSFPVDMLRYDACWPASTESALEIVSERPHEGCHVRLRSHYPPTEARWESFGWRIVG